MQIHKTVFISYRRTNTSIARNVYTSLTSQGFDVFFDLKSITNGDFEQIILNQIANRAHFILILTPSALERCISPDDWVRREIEEAMKLERNIVPLFFEGFNFDSETYHLRGDYLPTLKNYNGVNVYWDYFDEAINRIQNEFLNKSLDTVLHPISKQKQVEVQQIKEEIEKETVTPEQLKVQEYFERGIEKGKRSDYKGAIDEYTRAILFDETFAEAYFKRGGCYWNLGDKVQALADYEQAVIIDPEHSKVNIMRAHTYLEKAKYNEALVEAEKAVIANPELDEAYFARAQVKHHLEDYEGSIEDYDTAIDLNSAYQAAYNNRGYIYDKIGDYERAIANYSKAIELNPDDAIVYNNRGVTNRKLKDYERAIADYSKAIELNPDNAMAYNNRGSVYYYLGDYRQAIANLEFALRIDPNYDFAKKNLELAKKRLKEE